MKQLIMNITSKKAVLLAALIVAPALALTSSAQAAPRHRAPVARNQHNIIGSRNPKIYDGPQYWDIQRSKRFRGQSNRFRGQSNRFDQRRPRFSQKRFSNRPAPSRRFR
ncbi:hypothetical protein EON83_23775 [bacterium]|nr:MAG: hypothetical protein EON83_23775 [bacterium]